MKDEAQYLNKFLTERNTNQKPYVFSPGGSFIYYPDVRRLIHETCYTMFIDITCQQMLERIPDFNKRGVVGLESMHDNIVKKFYDERRQLYKRYSHTTIHAHDKSVEELSAIIAHAYKIYLQF